MTLGGSNTICLPPGTSCSGGCPQNTLGHSFPLPGTSEWLPLGSLQCKAATWAHSLPWLPSDPFYSLRKVLHSSSSQNIFQATLGSTGNSRVSKYKCHPNPMATDPSSTISQPNGSANFSFTENRIQNSQRATPWRAKVSQLWSL